MGPMAGVETFTPSSWDSLLSAPPGTRFPGVGVLPGVPTGTGVKPKAPGMQMQLAVLGQSTNKEE